MPTHITLSFASDGTQIAGQSSDLFQTLDATQPQASWRQTILQAVEAWTSQAHVNVGVVPDGGQPFGTPGALQGDPRFGDIRIGAVPLGLDSSALGFLPDPYFSGTWSGDIVLNASVLPDLSPTDLYAVMLHELGHAIVGLPSTDADPSSVMTEQPAQPVTELGPSDVAAVQSLYGLPDSSLAGYNSLAAALPIPTPTSAQSDTPIVAYGSVNISQPVIDYSFTVPGNDLSGVTVQLITSELSLLDPLVSVVDASGSLGSARSTLVGGGAVSILLTQLTPGSTYYIQVQAATPGQFDSGDFGLAVEYNDAPAPHSLIDSVLRGPYESLTADQISQLFQNPQAGSVTGQVAGSQLATAVALATTPGFAPDTRFQAVANVTSMPQQGYYSFQAPAATGSGPQLFTAAVDLPSPQGGSGGLVLLDASGNVVPSVVVMSARGVDTIQATGLIPGATYFLQVSMPAGGTAGGGNSILVADFLQTPGDQTNFETNTLGAAEPQSTSTFYVARTQFFQFQLSASSSGPGATGAVEMTILDQNGNKVLDITANAGQAAVLGSVMLAPGQYTVVFSVAGVPAGGVSPLTYAVQGIVLTEPIGVIVHNPKYTPIYMNPKPLSYIYLYPNGTLSNTPYLWIPS
jgi:hypothetical protein